MLLNRKIDGSLRRLFNGHVEQGGFRQHLAASTLLSANYVSAAVPNSAGSYSRPQATRRPDWGGSVSASARASAEAWNGTALGRSSR